jgi:hypothetical protein
MTREGIIPFKPGTVLLFILIAALGYGIFTWADTNIGKTNKNALEDQSDAIACSNIEIANEGVQESQNQTTLFFSVNRDLTRLNLEFKGRETVAKTLESVEKDKLESTTVNISKFSNVTITVPNCERVFRFE